jgi:hypothetical protein
VALWPAKPERQVRPLDASLRKVRHEEAIRHAFLEVPDHAGLGSGIKIANAPRGFPLGVSLRHGAGWRECRGGAHRGNRRRTELSGFARWRKRTRHQLQIEPFCVLGDRSPVDLPSLRAERPH